MAGGLHRDPRDRRSTHTRSDFSWLRSGTSNKSGITEAQYFYSLPKRPKLRGLQVNTQLQRHLAEGAVAKQYLEQKSLWLDNSRSQRPQRGRWIKAQSSILNRGARFGYIMDSVASVQNENFSGDGEEFTKVLRAVAKTKSCLSGQFIGIWQILWSSIMESSYFDTSSIRHKWHRWESRAQNEGTSAVLLQSGLDGNGGADSLECYCYLRNVEDLVTDWKNRVKGDLENHLKDRLFLLGVMADYFPICAERKSRLHQLGKKVVPGIFLGYAMVAGIWKGEILVADIEELGKLDAWEIHVRRLSRK